MVTDTKKEKSVFAFVRGGKKLAVNILGEKFTAPACTNKTFVLLTFLTKCAVAYIYEHKFYRDHCVEQISSEFDVCLSVHRSIHVEKKTN